MNILVLCTGNSCRSQMAEGFLKHLGFNVKSAGIESHGINKYAVKVMSEIGIDISLQCSKKISEIDISVIQVLITVCDSAKENCPLISGINKHYHCSFDDPSQNHDLKSYRTVRDEIKNYIFDLAIELTKNE